MSASDVDVAHRIDAGESLASIMFSRLGDVARATLMRCAVPRFFDGPTYDSLLRGDAGPPLPKLLDHEFVEPAGTGRFRVVRDFRVVALEAWWADSGSPPLTAPVPQALVGFARQLADRQRRENDSAAALHTLRLVGDIEVIELVGELSRRADETLDVAGYQRILDALCAPDRPALGHALAELRNERMAYFAARAMFEPQWRQSARYLHRPTVERDLLDLLDVDGRFGTSGPQVLLLNAMGGMGKTMQIRWFVARHCVPHVPRIPCAVVDFDRVDPVLATQYPWLVLLEIASQLDEQVPGGYFADLLAGDGRYLPLLQQRSRASEPALDLGDVDGIEVRQWFLSGLDAVRKVTVRQVVVLDTIEEVLLRPAGDPADLLTMLEAVRAAVPSLRMVLSGRLDVRSRLACLVRPGRDRVRTLEPFDPEEAQRYLREVRRVHKPDVVAAAAAQSRGLPFTLALFGDLLDLAPETTAAEITAFRGPQLMYVIERILERIDDGGVRWLLRYGVIPRRLSFDFLLEVIAPRLAETMRGHSAHDDPDRDDRPQDRTFQIWPLDVPVPDSPAQWRKLWDELCRFASTSSWVWLDRAGRIGFHDSVLEPLRDLLRGHEMSPLLHRDAAAFFERRARDPGGEWGPAMRDAIYHRFQADGAAARYFWDRTVAEAWREHDVRTVAEIAGEVLGADYATPEEPERPGSPAGPMLPRQLVADACVELADARILRTMIERIGPGDRLWNSAERELRRAKKISEAHPEEVTLDVARHAVLTARVLLTARGDVVGAHTWLDRVRTLPMEKLLRARWEHAFGDLLRRMGDPQIRYQRAFRLAGDAEDLARAVMVAETAAELETDRGDLTAAMAWSGRAVDIERHARRSGEVTVTGPGTAPAVRAAALTRAGQPYAALHVLAESTDDVAAALAQARAQLVARLADEAVSSCTRGLELAGGPRVAQHRAALLACRGLAHGQLMAFGAAVDDLIAATGRARQMLDRNAAAAYTLDAAELLLHEAGDLDEAAEQLTQAHEIGSTAPAIRLRLELMQAELDSRRGMRNSAAELLARGPEIVTRPRALPTDMVEVAISALIAGPAPEAVPELADALARVHPAGARLAMLGRLSAAAPLRKEADPVAVRRLRALVEPDAVADPADLAVQRLARAELLRVLGDDSGAAKAATAAMRVLADCPTAVLAGLRCGGKPPPGAELPHSVSVVAPTALLLARAALAEGDIDRAAELAALARNRADAPARRSGWLAGAFELIGTVAAARGQVQEARQAWARAATTYADLGDDAAHARTMGRLGSATTEVHARATGLEFAELWLREDIHDPGRVEVRRSWPPRPGDRGGGRAERLPLPDPSRASLQRVVDQLDHDPHRWAADAGAALLDRWRLGEPGLDPAAVRLDLTATAAMLPWELIVDPNRGLPLMRHPDVSLVYRQVECPSARQVRQLQRALNRAAGDHLGGPSLDVDGIAGPVTVAALRAFQRNAGIEDDGIAGSTTWTALTAALQGGSDPAATPMRVVVVQASTAQQMTQRRGSEYWGVADASRRYAAGGATVMNQVVDAGSLDRSSAERIRAFHPDVLHVSATVRRSSGAVMLDFGSRTDPVWMPVTLLNEMAWPASPEVAPPLVVLDIATPPSRAEAVRALLLRNDFAHRLVALGDVDAVLAAGLQDDRSAELPTTPTLLARQSPPAQVLRDLHDRLAPAATALPAALVAAVPSYVLLPHAL